MADRLEVSGLSAGYGAGLAIRGVSLRVGPGEAVALLGRNGAGKTTTLMTIAGALPAQTGSFAIDGVTLTGRPSHVVARAGLSLVPQGRRIFSTLSVRENLVVGARSGDLSRVYGWFPILEQRARVAGNALSGGEQQMLAIGRALMTTPHLLLMDEPSEGLAPKVVEEIGRLVSRLRADAGLSILIAEQNLSLALAVAERVYVLERGEIVHHGPAAEFRDDRSIQKKYLGV